MVREPAVEETKENIVDERDSKSKRKGKRGGRKKSLSPTGEDTKAAAPGSWASMVAHNASVPAPPSPPRRTEKKETEAKPTKEESKPEKSAAAEQQGGKQQRGQRLRDPDCTLVIKNISENTREREVRDMFEPYAIQTKSRILGINVSGAKTLAFVDYDSPEPVLLALKDNKQFQLHGRNLELEPKMVDKSRAKGYGGRNRGQGGDTSNNGFKGSGRPGQQRRRGSGGRGDRGGGVSGSGSGRGGRGGR